MVADTRTRRHVRGVGRGGRGGNGVICGRLVQMPVKREDSVHAHYDDWAPEVQVIAITRSRTSLLARDFCRLMSAHGITSVIIDTVSLVADVAASCYAITSIYCGSKTRAVPVVVAGTVCPSAMDMWHPCLSTPTCVQKLSVQP